MDRGSCIAALRTLNCLQASEAVGASRIIEGDDGERKVVSDMGKIRQPSHADINVTPKRAGVWSAHCVVMAAVARVLGREKGGGGSGRGRSGHGAWRWRCELYPMRDSLESSEWASTASAIGVGTASGGRAACRMQHGYVVESV
jgi:hypothetical protein